MPQQNRDAAGVLSKPIRDLYQAIKNLGTLLTTTTLTISGTVSVVEPVSVDDNGGSLTVDTPQLPTTIGQKAMAASTSVVIASDQSAVPVSGTVTSTPSVNATGTTTSAAATGATQTLLAANASRRGATIFNDSTVSVRVKLGAIASPTSFTILMRAQSYYEVPFNYSGIIDGIYDSATGSARVTEIT